MTTDDKPGFWLRRKRKTYGRKPRPEPTWDDCEGMIALAHRIRNRRWDLEEIGSTDIEFMLWLFDAETHLIDVAYGRLEPVPEPYMERV